MQAISDLLKFKRGSHESAMQEHFDVGAGPSSQQIADKRNAEYEAEQQRARDLKRYSRRLPDPMMADGNPFINMLDEPIVYRGRTPQQVQAYIEGDRRLMLGARYNFN